MGHVGIGGTPKEGSQNNQVKKVSIAGLWP